MKLFLYVGVFGLAGWVSCAADLPPAAFTAFAQQHCFECHDSETKKGGFDLEKLAFKLGERESFDEWAMVFDRVSLGEMPPPKKTRPAKGDLVAALKPLYAALSAQSGAEQRAAGRVALRRLNRNEWENTVHDLLGIEVPLAFMLPEESPAGGFDTVAEGLRFSQMHMESFLEAADVALDAAIELAAAPECKTNRVYYKQDRGVRENLDTPEGAQKDPNSRNKHRITFRELPDAVVRYSSGYSPERLDGFGSRGAGHYRVRVSAYGFASKGKPVTLRIYADNYREKRLLAFFDMPPDSPRVIEFDAWLKSNEKLSLAPYGTDADDKGQSVYAVGGTNYTGAGLAIQWVESVGPIVGEWPPPSVRNLFADTPVLEIEKKKQPYRNGKKLAYELVPADTNAAARSVLEKFATRAFRRPLAAGEADRYIALTTNALAGGRNFADALRVGFKAILTAPQFLLFDELPGKLNDFALASRLSYFFWSTMPDEQLLNLAAAKKLSSPATLRAQTERMLADPRAKAFVSNFTGQWLDLRNIDATTPDAKLYPEFDELLKVSMVGETEAFFAEVLNKNLSVANFISSDFAMLNSRMAEHYEIESPTDESFRRVVLPKDSVRGGVLTQASVLKVTANGTVSSPVLRGAWVMKRLLGRPPHPPPPNVGAIEPDTRGATTVREQLAKHRTLESCASCHVKMDPPGFALESFDVIGSWRDRYRSIGAGDPEKKRFHGKYASYKLGPVVDASGELADGRTFSGIADFKKLLLGDQRLVARCLTQKLVTYGTGAAIEFADRDDIEAILDATTAKSYPLRSIIHEIVQSPLFLNK